MSEYSVWDIIMTFLHMHTLIHEKEIKNWVDDNVMRSEKEKEGTWTRVKGAHT